ncbi:hypothetical protein GJ496_000398 [Pomphorhynchus laevis]|nr:hypothetical protein GJ496_000398 [Pomphorhynchus laevis]
MYIKRKQFHDVSFIHLQSTNNTLGSMCTLDTHLLKSSSNALKVSSKCHFLTDKSISKAEMKLWLKKYFLSS